MSFNTAVLWKTNLLSYLYLLFKYLVISLQKLSDILESLKKMEYVYLCMCLLYIKRINFLRLGFR